MKNLKDKVIEKKFLNLAIKNIRNLIENFKFQTSLWPSTIYYRIDDNNNLCFLDIYDGNTEGDLVYYLKNNKPKLTSINKEIKEKINRNINGEQAQKAFIYGLFDETSKALKETLKNNPIKEDFSYFNY